MKIQIHAWQWVSWVSFICALEIHILYGFISEARGKWEWVIISVDFFIFFNIYVPFDIRLIQKAQSISKRKKKMSLEMWLNLKAMLRQNGCSIWWAAQRSLAWSSRPVWPVDFISRMWPAKSFTDSSLNTRTIDTRPWSFMNGTDGEESRFPVVVMPTQRDDVWAQQYCDMGQA